MTYPNHKKKVGAFVRRINILTLRPLAMCCVSCYVLMWYSDSTGCRYVLINDSLYSHFVWWWPGIEINKTILTHFSIVHVKYQCNPMHLMVLSQNWQVSTQKILKHLSNMSMLSKNKKRAMNEGNWLNERKLRKRRLTIRPSLPRTFHNQHVEYLCTKIF